jgi:major membrane immunogen (membrane-anchored lipoprotein)
MRQSLSILAAFLLTACSHHDLRDQLTGTRWAKATSQCGIAAMTFSDGEIALRSSAASKYVV